MSSRKQDKTKTTPRQTTTAAYKRFLQHGSFSQLFDEAFKEDEGCYVAELVLDEHMLRMPWGLSGTEQRSSVWLSN